MRVPVRRLPETRVSERQQGFARPAAPLNVSPLTEVIEGFRNQLLDEQDARQRVDLNRRLIQEVNELQSDFAGRRTNPEISSIDFADNTNTAYTERHSALLNELRQQNYSEDLLEDFETRLGTVRQGFFERGLVHQMTQLDSRAAEQIEEIGSSASQYASTHPDNYESARDMVLDSIRTQPDLTEDRRAALEDQELARIRDAAGRALLMHNPQFIIDTLDPQGLTAPYRPPAATGTTTVNTQGLDSDRAAVAEVLSSGGLSPQVVAGFLGNFDVEDGYGGATGDNGTASGIAQWREERRANFRQRFGKEPHQATPQEQAQFVLWELENPAAAGMTADQANAIRNARTAEEAAELIDQFYERSSGEHRSRRVTAAAGYRVQTASVQLVDLPPSQVPQQSDSFTPQQLPVPQPRVAGNLPLNVRQQVTNAGGTVSTVRTISIGTENGEVLIPTVINGEVVSDEEAIAHYRSTGENFGTFATAEEATAYAQSLSRQHGTDIASIRTGNALLDDLNGVERLQLLSHARERMNQVTASQRAEMDVRIGNIVAERMNGESGTPLPPEEDVLRLYGPVEGPQRMAQLQAAEAARPAIINFRTQSGENIQAALDALEPDPGSPTYATELQIYRAAKRAAQALLTEREQDPAAYAMRYFPAVREAAQRSTAHYYAALDRVYETLGIDTDDAPVMSTEATERLTRQYLDMSPPQRQEFMRQNMSEMGEARFRRFVRDMEGTTAESDARIFALLRTYPGRAGNWRSVYNQILEGREYIAQDPARRPNTQQVLEQFRGYRDAIINLNADASLAIQEAAEALYVQRGGDPANVRQSLYREALATALGGSLPVQMGSLSDYTILPPGSNQRQFEAWIERQTLTTITRSSVERRPPRYGDLRTAVPISVIMDEGVFVMVSPGRYMIKMAGDGRPLMTSTGRPFLVNVNPRDVVR